MANRILGVEFSPESIKLVEVSFARRLKVHNFAIVDNRSIDPERRFDQLNHALQVRGFEAKEAVVAVTGVQVEHRLLTLPPLSGRELRFVMQREAKKSVPAGVTDTFWDFQLLQTKEELGIKKRQILLVTANTELVAQAQEFFGRTKLKLERVTTVGESLLNLTEHVGYWKKEVVKNLVHFSPNSVHVLFVQHGTLLLCRDIPIRYGDLDQDQRIERIMTEIKRSTLYFRQNFPQGEIGELLFSGESDMIGNLVARAKDELGIESNVLRFEDNLDPGAFKGDWDEFRFHVPSLAAAFGAAWHKTLDSSLNLIPGKAGSKEGPPVYHKLIKIAAAIALTVSLLAGFRYFAGTRQVVEETATVEQSIAELEPVIQGGIDADAERAVAQRRAAFVQRMAGGVQWNEALRSLSLIVPETAVFESIAIEGGQSSAMVIKGYLRGAQAATNVSADFDAFFQDLSGLEHFLSVELSEQLSVSYENVRPPGADAETAPIVISRVNFEVRCVLTSSC